MPDTTTDTQLVTDHLAGDRAAFAAIYDRYGATLYDTAAAMTRRREDAADITQDVFVVAAERMSQLRDPSRLKPWLFAILRNEVYRRSGKRKRVVLTDFTEPVAEMTLPSQPAADTDDLEYRELAELVRGAAFGLDERDQLVLEYSIRQGLEGEDLADALGVSAQQSYGLVHRMRQRTERSLGAYCVARRGSKECDELAKILDGWDGEFTVLIRKRVARHIDRCETCERSRRTLAPLALFGAAPVFAAPSDLRGRVLAAAGHGSPPAYGFDAPGGFPSAVGFVRRMGLWVAISTLALLIVGGAAVWVLAAGDDDVTVVDAAASPTSSATSADPQDPAVAGRPTPTTATSATATDPGATSTTATSASSTTSSAPGVAASTTIPIVATLPTTTIVATTPPTTAASPSTTAAPATTTTPTTTPAPAPAPPQPTGPTTSTTMPAGSLSLSAGSIDFGTTTGQTTVTLGNTGGRAVDWTVTSGPAALRRAPSPFSTAPASGTLLPGASVEVTVSIDRAWPIEGPVGTERLTFGASGTTATLDLDATIARPPTVGVGLPGTTHCPIILVSGAPNPLVATAVVDDESPPLTVIWRLVGPNGTRSVTMTERGAEWRGVVGLDFDGDGAPDAGQYSWTIMATDAFGNRTSAAGETDVQTFHCV